MVPTKERNHSSILISYGSHGVLVDCGEGTQRQLKIAGVKLAKINKILISHWHGDHVLGLPGLLQSMSASDYEGALTIYGPEGTKGFFKSMFEAFVFDNKIEMKIVEVKPGKIFENSEYVLESQELEHNIPTIGYSFIEKDKRRINLRYVRKLGIPEGPLLGKLQKGKDIVWNGKMVRSEDATKEIEGKKITIINDTIPCRGIDLLAKNSDLLICESTYTSSLERKAAEYGHMTAKQAAEIANRCGVKKLVLTHFSARYKNSLELEEEAGDYFNNVLGAQDFMKINL